MSFIALFRRQVRTYIYNPVYKGPFEYKKSDTMMSKFPFGANRTKLESVLSEIKEVQSNPISQQDVSPFHLVARYKPFAKATWQEKVALRRLGIHQRELNVLTVIPNTPQYNKLLWIVKHLIKVRPLKFPNGIPTEADIGSIKIDVESGEMLINPAFKVSAERLDKAENSLMFKGKYLREYLKWASGLIGRGLPNLEVQNIDGNRIMDHDKAMKNYYKHKHPLYKN